MYTNTPNVSAAWVGKPSSPVALTNGSVSDIWPSAFLRIQIPFPDKSDSGTTLTCLVDARWAKGRNIAADVGNFNDAFLQHGLIDSNEGSNFIEFLAIPADDGTWHTVDMDLSWLNVFTPPLQSL